MPRLSPFTANTILATLVLMCAIACGSRFVVAQAQLPHAASDRTVPEDDPPTKAVDQPGNKRLVSTAKDKEEQPFKVTRTNNLVRILPLDISFQIPQRWIDWNERFHNSLHFTKKDLAAVEDGDVADWDPEYATVVNAVLPFEQCALHAGGEGWGREAVSYADLQMRVYILDEAPEKIEAKAVSEGAHAVRTLFTPRRIAWRNRGGPIRERPEPPIKDADKLPKDMKIPVERNTKDGWRQVALSYDLFYGDYGAKASIDFRLRRTSDHTVAVVFMHTNFNKQAPAIKAILASFTEAKKVAPTPTKENGR